MHFALTLITVLVLGGAGQVLAGGKTVIVGVYDFPPAAQVSDTGEVAGLAADLLAALNVSQDDYTFVPLVTSPKRRQLDFIEQRYDVIFFESPDWSWDKVEYEATLPILMDEEVYVALDKPGRDQSFFNDVASRRIVAMLGYHYGFTENETDEIRLRSRFDIELSHSHNRNLELILADRPSVAEVAVVSRSWLDLFARSQPALADRLLVSDRIDQRYLLSGIVRPGGPISATDLEALLEPLIRDGAWQEMVRAHHLQLPPGLQQQKISGHRAEMAP